jgi:biopolymer transport protein ExbB
MKSIKTLFTVSALALSTMSFSASAGPLDDLLKEVKADRVSEAKLDAKREAEFKAARDQKQALVNKAKKELADEQKRQRSLQQKFADNEKRISDKEAELESAKGTLGEMFGVVRGASGKALGLIAASNVSAQPEYANRTELLQKLSEAKEIPNIFELEELWFALQTEMTESGKIVKFNATVTNLDGSETSTSVTRIGSFNLLADGQYVGFNPEKGLIQPFARQPEDAGELAFAEDFQAQSSGFHPVYIDPAKGALINLFKQKATMESVTTKVAYRVMLLPSYYS